MFVENLRISQEHAAQRVVKCSVFFFIVLPLLCCSRWFRDLKQGGGPDRPPPRPSHMVNFVSEQTQKKAAADDTRLVRPHCQGCDCDSQPLWAHLYTFPYSWPGIVCVCVYLYVCVSVCVCERDHKHRRGGLARVTVRWCA